MYAYTHLQVSHNLYWAACHVREGSSPIPIHACVYICIHTYMYVYIYIYTCKISHGRILQVTYIHIYIHRGRRRSDWKELRLPKFEQSFTGVPVNFKQFFSGVNGSPRHSNDNPGIPGQSGDPNIVSLISSASGIWIQCGEDAWDAVTCRSISAKMPIIIGPFAERDLQR